MQKHITTSLKVQSNIADSSVLNSTLPRRTRYITPEDIGEVLDAIKTLNKYTTDTNPVIVDKRIDYVKLDYSEDLSKLSSHAYDTVQELDPQQQADLHIANPDTPPFNPNMDDQMSLVNTKIDPLDNPSNNSSK